jgi:hypothetical protein
MKRITFLLACVTVIAAVIPLQSAQKSPLFEVHRPTILAFFPPVTEAELSKDPDTNTALDDFQFYAGKVREPLEERGIELRQVYAHSFSIRTGKAVTTFKPTNVDVGYYLVAPGRKPRVQYGVMTDADLLQLADEYFGIAWGQSTPEMCKDSRPDCPEAVKFFTKFRQAITTNDRNAVAAMARYPLRVTLNHKNALIRTKQELLRNFDELFDPRVRCVILGATEKDVWGNWQGFTIPQGAIWWERSSEERSAFKLITVNNDAPYQGCDEAKPR